MDGCRLTIAGRVFTFHVDEATGLWTPLGPPTDNTWMYAWGFIAAKAIGHRRVDYGLAAVYMEYENVASPATAVTNPPVAADDDIGYYDGLAPSATRDFLRIPLVVTPTISVAPGYEAYFAAGEGNRLTVAAQSVGTAGVFGKAFSAAANSKLAGVALVATPVQDDRTRDILFARAYYPAEEQQVKTTGGQFGIQYQLTFAV